MENKLLTIAIPTYNMEALLDRCLSSLVISDTDLRKRIEVLVVNDGSKDNSLEIAKKYENQYPELFVIIDKENGNYGSCLNKAIEKASGIYFKTLDADDYYETSDFEKFVHRLSCLRECPDMILTNGFLDRPTTIRKAVRCESSDIIYRGNILLKEHPFSYNIQRVCFLTSIVKDITMSTRISYTDVELLTYTIGKVGSYLKWLDWYVYHYILGREGQSVSIKSYSNNSKHIYKILKRYSEKYDNNKSIATRDNEAESLLSLTKIYYQINILYKVTSEEDYKNFKEIDEIIFTKLSELAQKLLCSDFNGIRYIKLWKDSSLLFPIVVPVAKCLEACKLFAINTKHKLIG